MIVEHSKLKKITLKELISKVKNSEVISNYIILERITIESLGELIHYDDIKQEYIMEYNIIIQNCFLEYIDLSSIHFNNKFEIRYSNVKTAIFNYSYFSRKVNFNSTTFENMASFYQVEFYNKANFNNTFFKCEAEFSYCYFTKEVIFRNSYFKLNAKFNYCTFKNRALFTQLIFEKLEFKASKFHDYFKISNIENNIFKKESEKHRKKAIVLFVSAHFYDLVDLDKLECYYIDFSKAISNDIVEMIDAKFKLIALDNFKFNVIYLEIEQIIKEGKVLKNSKFKIDNYENVKTMKKTLVNLKNNYQNLGWHKEEDWIYRELKMVELLEKKQAKKYLDYFFGRYILNLFFGFGTVPIRAFLSSIFIGLVYSLIYCFVGINSRNPCIIHHGITFKSLANYFYFSAVTFTTVGYGDLAPTGIARFIAASEGFLGIFMMSAFTVTFARKLIR